MARLLFVLSLILMTISNCFAADTEWLLKNLPSSFSGTYTWQPSAETYYMSVSFNDRRVVGNGDVQFTGTEYFVHVKDKNKTFSSKVRAVINPRSLAFDMSEIPDQEQKAGFINMVYSGKITPDLRAIAASWNGTDGKRVNIDLTAKAP